MSRWAARRRRGTRCPGARLRMQMGEVEVAHTMATKGYWSIISRMFCISASRFGAHTSRIRDMLVGKSWSAFNKYTLM